MISDVKNHLMESLGLPEEMLGEFVDSFMASFDESAAALQPFADGSWPASSLPVLPTQLVEAAGCLVLFAFLLWLYRRLNPAGAAARPARFPGAVAAGYFLGYGAIRFVDEMLRADERLHFGWFSISQAISVALWALGLALLARLALRPRRGDR